MRIVIYTSVFFDEFLELFAGKKWQQLKINH